MRLLSAFVIGASTLGWADSIPAKDLTLKSTGGLSSTDYNLWSNGFVGTFLKLAKPATVTLKITAAGQPAKGVWPEMGLRVEGKKRSWVVASPDFQTYTTSVPLPAGTSLVRIEFRNDYYDPDAGEDRNLLLRSLTVNAPDSAALQIVNPTDEAATRDAVFSAADTTVESVRKKTATLRVLKADGSPLLAGTKVQAKLVKHAFNFSTAVPGVAMGDMMSPDPVPGSDAAILQSRIAANFNMIVPENAGKWQWNEDAPGHPTLDYLDTIYAFAKKTGLKARHHTLLWGASQPEWVVELENKALGGDASAKEALRQAIAYRIDYLAKDRGRQYVELDGINECAPGHQPVFLDIFGPQGVADIYTETIRKLAVGGSSARVYFNDYSVVTGGDPYANWYLGFINGILNAGIAKEDRGRLGVGVQYYIFDPAGHDPVNIYRAFANLGTLGFPITLSEFGVNDPYTAEAPKILEETLRMVFGTDQATTFNLWGVWANSMWINGAALWDAKWGITATGKVWQQMTGVRNWGLPGVPFWKTSLEKPVDANSSLTLRGFLGKYEVSIGSTKASFTLTPATSELTVRLSP